MPLYEYQCGDGHVTEKFFPITAETRPKSVRCGTCPRLAKRVYSLAGVVPDFPEHYNWSFGCIVKNRAHHKELQRKHNVHDWEDVKENPQSSRYRKEGLV